MSAQDGHGVHVECGTINDLQADQTFDTILYVDVLEHIEEDRAELVSAAAHLRQGGRVIVVSPAHQWLFSPFDEAIGHYRRYSRSSLSALGAGVLSLERIRYLDSVGLLASSANRLLLKQSMPTARQIAIWDSYFVPLSGVVDPVMGYRLGKSLIAVWQAH